MQALPFMRQIEIELNDREWTLFESLKEWTSAQRDAWRDAWRLWRQQQLTALQNGEAGLQVKIKEDCIACFDCEIMCPDIFKIEKQRSRVRRDAVILDQHNKPHIKTALLNDAFDDLHLAREACPVEAIVIIDEAAVPEPLPQLFIQD